MATGCYLTLFRHLSLSSVAHGRFTRLQLVSTQSWCMTLLVDQNSHVYLLKSIKDFRLRIPPCFSSSALHVFFTLLQWFVRWGISGRTAAILGGLASRNCSKFLRSSCLAFCVLLAFMWCIHRVVWIQLQLGRSPISSYQIDQSFIWTTTRQ